MAINPHDIDLSEEQQRQLAKAAEKQGTSWQELLNDALANLTDLDNEVDVTEEYRELFPTSKSDDTPVTLERIRQILSKCSDSLAQEIIAERKDRF